MLLSIGLQRILALNYSSQLYKLTRPAWYATGPGSGTTTPPIPTKTPLTQIFSEDSRKKKKTSPERCGTISSTVNFDGSFGIARPTLNECCQPCVAVKRKLFTPGPLLVSDRVKNAMLYDIALRHADFAYLVKFVRNALLQVARVDPDVYTAILLNGSGTCAAEGTLRTILGNSKKKLLLMDNGKFAKRITEVCKSSCINIKVIPVNLKALQETLIASPADYGAVMAVHCETSTGMVNPVDEIGNIVKKCAPECLYIVDAITSFGAIPLNICNIDFMIGNACKSLQSVPGISFVIAKTAALEKYRSRNNLGLVLDIASQHDELELSAMFRFTPPTHAMLAFKESLLEYADEGGLKGRSARYRRNSDLLKDEMLKMGFKQLYKDSENPNGYLVTSFLYPDIPQFVFAEFCKRLDDAGHVICNEKQYVPQNFFRIGSMGDIYEDDVRALTNCIREVCFDMKIQIPITIPVY